MRRLAYKIKCDECGKQARCWTWILPDTGKSIFYCDKCKKRLEGNLNNTKC